MFCRVPGGGSDRHTFMTNHRTSDRQLREESALSESTRRSMSTTALSGPPPARDRRRELIPDIDSRPKRSRHFLCQMKEILPFVAVLARRFGRSMARCPSFGTGRTHLSTVVPKGAQSRRRRGGGHRAHRIGDHRPHRVRPDRPHRVRPDRPHRVRPDRPHRVRPDRPHRSARNAGANSTAIGDRASSQSMEPEVLASGIIIVSCTPKIAGE